jgi:hypothetical protein
MAEKQKSQSWWETIPGILTAVAGIISAIAMLIVALNKAGFFEKIGKVPDSPTRGTSVTVSGDKNDPIGSTKIQQKIPSAEVNHQETQSTIGQNNGIYDSQRDTRLAATISKLIEHKVVLSAGINYITGNTIVFDPYSGAIIEPCEESFFDVPGGVYCTNFEPAQLEAPEYLFEAIKKSHDVKTIVVKKDGKETLAQFVISVDIFYKGFQCQAHWSGGDVWQTCVSTK